MAGSSSECKLDNFKCKKEWYHKTCSDEIGDDTCDPRMKDQLLNGKEGLCYLVGFNDSCDDKMYACPTKTSKLHDKIPAHSLVSRPNNIGSVCYSSDGIDYYVTGKQCPLGFKERVLDEKQVWVRSHDTTTDLPDKCKPNPTPCILPNNSRPKLCKTNKDCNNITMEQVFDKIIKDVNFESPDAIKVTSAKEMLNVVSKDFSVLHDDALESDEVKFESSGMTEDNIQKTRSVVRSMSKELNKQQFSSFTADQCQYLGRNTMREACNNLFKCENGACNALVNVGGEQPFVNIPKDAASGNVYCQNMFCLESKNNCPKDICKIKGSDCVQGEEIVATTK